MKASKSVVVLLSAILVMVTAITTLLALRAMREAEAEERRGMALDAAYEALSHPGLFDTANVVNVRLAEHLVTEHPSQVAGTWTNGTRLPSRRQMGRGNPVGVIDRSPRREPLDKGALPRCSPGGATLVLNQS